MVQVNYYETATMRKTGKMKEGEICGTFFVNINPVEIPEVPPLDPELKGEEKDRAIKRRDAAIKKRDFEIAQAELDCKFRACDMVRNLTGHDGVLVASIQAPEKETNSNLKEEK